ncbi:UNVERIFIED_CONTAM: hypothetical protein Sangu_2529500 [Sesamum angustifolium]|uniref:Uncharacterized protein n=1 Tax=Sesamum angustifolium TaxID=2727405 RepID=A0AAW2JDR8_9LAMI
MASLDESIRFVGESRPDEDPSEGTLKRTDLHFASPSSVSMRSQRQATAAFLCLLDEEDEEETSPIGKDEEVVKEEVMEPPPSRVDWGPSNLKTPSIEQLRREFYVPNSMIINTPISLGCPRAPLDNCLPFFATQL